MLSSNLDVYFSFFISLFMFSEPTARLSRKYPIESVWLKSIFSWLIALSGMFNGIVLLIFVPPRVLF